MWWKMLQGAKYFRKMLGYLQKVGPCLNFQLGAQKLWSHHAFVPEVHGRTQTDLKTLHFGHNGEQMHYLHRA